VFDDALVLQLNKITSQHSPPIALALCCHSSTKDFHALTGIPPGRLHALWQNVLGLANDVDDELGTDEAYNLQDPLSTSLQLRHGNDVRLCNVADVNLAIDTRREHILI
jgi:hypothetical protein